MWIRRAFFHWLLPAAAVLPLWLLVGWGIFNAGAWSFVWVLFIAVPSVLIGQLVLALLVRARPTVRASRAVSWWDVLGFSVWHAATIAVGFFPERVFVPLLLLAVVTAVGLFWLSLWQLWNDARGTLRRYSIVGETESTPGADRRSERVIVVAENPDADPAR